MNETIRKQQQAATEIIRIANEAGITVIVWTAEDTNEAVNRAADLAGITLTDEQAFALAGQLLDENDDYIEEVCIERGWNAIHDAAYDIVTNGKGEKR